LKIEAMMFKIEHNVAQVVSAQPKQTLRLTPVLFEGDGAQLSLPLANLTG
jgi:hypothetical protein